MAESPRVLIVLQCAYGVTERQRQRLADNKTWLEELWASHTGKRLRAMLPEAGYEVRIVNASPQIGSEAGACFPPDLAHLRAVIEEEAPDLILACGEVARRGLDALGVCYVAAPHPAWRALSCEEADRIRGQLATLSTEELSTTSIPATMV